MRKVQKELAGEEEEEVPKRRKVKEVQKELAGEEEEEVPKPRKVKKVQIGDDDDAEARINYNFAIVLVQVEGMIPEPKSSPFKLARAASRRAIRESGRTADPVRRQLFPAAKETKESNKPAKRGLDTRLRTGKRVS